MKLGDSLPATLAEIPRRALESLPHAWPEATQLLGQALAEPADPQCTIPLATACAVGATLQDAVPFAAAWLLIGMSVRILDDVGDCDNPDGMDRAIGAAAAMNLGSGLLIHATFAAWGSAALHTDDTAMLAACRDVGFRLGLMLQLLDDTEACWFPDGPSDLAQGKITYPIYIGLEQSGPLAAELATLVHAADAAYHEPRIVEILDELRVRDHLTWAAIRERDAALAALSRCSYPAGRGILQTFVDWTFRDVEDMRRRPRRNCAA